MDARERRKQGVARIIGLHEDDGFFDRAFWAAIPAAKRLELVWDMALEYCEWQGKNGGQSRLHRSVCRVKRRPG